MANLTVPRRVQHFGEQGKKHHLPVAASTNLYKGTMIAQLAATGGCVAGSTAASGRCIGVATHNATNNPGSLGDKRIEVEYDRIFAFDNGGGADAFSDVSLIGQAAYMIDDHTVGDNDGGATRQIAGEFRGFEANGQVRVWITGHGL